MTVRCPASSEPAVSGGRVGDRWYAYFTALAAAINGPAELPSYAVARLPRRARDGSVVFAADAAGGGVPVYYRGSQWRRFDTNAEVTA